MWWVGRAASPLCVTNEMTFLDLRDCSDEQSREYLPSRMSSGSCLRSLPDRGYARAHSVNTTWASSLAMLKRTSSSKMRKSPNEK